MLGLKHFKAHRKAIITSIRLWKDEYVISLPKGNNYVYLISKVRINLWDTVINTLPLKSTVLLWLQAYTGYNCGSSCFSKFVFDPSPKSEAMSVGQHRDNTQAGKQASNSQPDQQSNFNLALMIIIDSHKAPPKSLQWYRAFKILFKKNAI